MESTKVSEDVLTELGKNNLRGYAKKSGLAFEALTRVQEQLEQNSQFLQIPYKNSVILVYSSFFYLEN